MSALDLFASAMGVFVLITIVLFPYYPNTGDSEERVSEVKAEYEERLEDARKRIREAKSEVALPSLDLVVALDTTNSMREEISGLKADAKALITVLSKLCPSFSMGVVDFKDDTDEPSVRVHGLADMAGEAARRELREFIASMEAGSNMLNQDHEENITGALQASVSMQWRDDAERHLVVLISDNGAIREEAALEVARGFSGKRKSVKPVIGGTVARDSAKRFMPRLARAGNGKVVRASESMMGTILEAIIDT